MLSDIKTLVKQDRTNYLAKIAEKHPQTNFNYKASYNSKTKMIPWSIRWIKNHFNYSGYVADEQRVVGKELVTDIKLYNRVKKVAKIRAPYRYTNIANNARDLGGYKTKDGHVVKTGLLIRSNNLHNLTKQGAKWLYHHNVNNVIDLRDQDELNQAPDPNEIMPDGSRYFTGADLRAIVHHVPVFTNQEVLLDRPMTFRYGVIHRYGTLFLTRKNAQKAYAKSIKSIINNHQATLYHCVEGRDRTGLLSVLLLTALGVDKHTIFNDYLLTDYYAHTKPYVRQYKQLKHFYAVVNNKYGNIHHYLNMIGITDNDILELRNQYLEK